MRSAMQNFRFRSVVSWNSRNKNVIKSSVVVVSGFSVENMITISRNRCRRLGLVSERAWWRNKFITSLRNLFTKNAHSSGLARSQSNIRTFGRHSLWTSSYWRSIFCRKSGSWSVQLWNVRLRSLTSAKSVHICPSSEKRSFIQLSWRKCFNWNFWMGEEKERKSIWKGDVFTSHIQEWCAWIKLIIKDKHLPIWKR